MNERKLIAKAGYTVEVASWENDADYYRTMSRTYETKEEALAVKDLCRVVFCSKNNGENGIGNMMEDDYEEGGYVICEYLIKNPTLLEINDLDTPEDLKGRVMAEWSDLTDDNWRDCISDYLDIDEKLRNNWASCIMELYNHELMGWSEWYFSRIAEKVDIFYTKEDVYLERVKIEG